MNHSHQQYRPLTWTDPRLEVRDSPIAGKGLFVRTAVHAGEILEIFGGTLFTQADVQNGKHRPFSLIAIDEGLYLGMPKESTIESIDQYTNHSCDPNTWLNDEVTLVARRDLRAGEEITMDYATWEDDEEYVHCSVCTCGSALCRGRVTGRDWRRSELQTRYAGHFSPFLHRRIEKLSK